MKKSLFSIVLLSSVLFLNGGRRTAAQDDSRILVNVVLVQLNVAVTDKKGNYVSGLKPEDFVITEDKIQEKVSTFEEGNEPALRLVLSGPQGKIVSQVITPAPEPTAVGAGDTPNSSPVPAFTGANAELPLDRGARTHQPPPRRDRYDWALNDLTE